MADKEKHDECKDRLIAGINSAIKQLQIECCHEQNDVQFTGNMWQVQELCLRLDDTLSHGLKQLSGGYWPFVREVTHKSIANFILELPCAISNLVRGWTWLYIALNDHALESYIRTMISHPKITERHYLPHALLRDSQRLQVLSMMSAGLEHLPFQLAPDSACIGGLKPTVNEQESEACDEDAEEAECASIVSCNSFQDSQDTNASDDPEVGVIMIVMIDPKTGLPSKEDIIHSSTRGNRKRKKDRPNPIHNNNNENANLPEKTKEMKTNTRNVEVVSTNPSMVEFCFIHPTVHDRELFLNSILHNEAYSVQLSDSVQSIQNESVKSRLGPSLNVTKEIVEEASVYDKNYSLRNGSSLGDTDLVSEMSNPFSMKEGLPDVILRPKNPDQKAPSKRVSFDPENLIHVVNIAHTTDGTHPIGIFSANTFDASCGTPSLSERGVPEGQEDPMSSSTASISYPVSDNPSKDFYKIAHSPGTTNMKQNSLLNQSWELFPKPIFVDKAVVETSVKQLEDEIKSEVCQANEQPKEYKRGEVPLENNFHLMIMLEVVVDQEEKVYKVFQATIKHTIGTPFNIYIVLTDRRFYLTHLDKTRKHYKVNAYFLYSQIEFIQLSLNYQIINVVCVAPRRRFWLCTGDEEITRDIVSSLEVAIRRSPRVISLPSVYTDSTAQSIAIRKWVAKETGIEANRVSVDHYALIKWEDPNEAATSVSPIGPKREGDLMYRYEGSSVFGIKHWRPGYFRLKGGVVYQFSDALDRNFRSYEQLLGGGCLGCRRVQNSDRPHTFELILTDGRTLQLAAPSEAEASAWLQVFLQTVSQGLSDSERTPRVSACLILAAEKLFVFHEELETHYIRSLGKVEIQDVSNVQLDPKGSQYCILEFESVEATESSGDWALYFASSAELDKFLNALNQAWQNLYQVPLPRSNITDPALQMKCQV